LQLLHVTHGYGGGDDARRIDVGGVRDERLHTVAATAD
jgi:hypothetical protein